MADKRKKLKSLIYLYSILGIVMLFLIVSYFVQQNLKFLENLLQDSVFGMFIYVMLLVIESVFAPVTLLPIIPAAANIWGPSLTGFLTIIGWTIGSLAAFGIARKYGFPIVGKIIPLAKMEKIENLLPERHIFFGIVILRIAIPIDVLSYVLGMFTKIKWKTYTLATLIGILPASFFFAYLGELPFAYQLIGAEAGGIIILVIVIVSLVANKSAKSGIMKYWNKHFR